MDRGAWRATVHVVTESDVTERLSTHAGHIGEKDKQIVGFQGSVTHPSSPSVF